MEVARRIAATITNKNRSKLSVADAAGIPNTTFDRKLRGASHFTIDEVARVADALDIHPGKLFPPSLLSDVA
jgi:transcriptional regulator with XRE-family HTH domain